MDTLKRTNIIAAFAAIALVALPSMGQSARVADVTFEPRIETESAGLDLVGAGLLRYLGIFKVYAGAFYLDETANRDEALDDHAKRLEVQYFRSFKGEDFGPATIDLMAKNVDAATMERLGDKIALHNSLYPDVKPGDRATLTYLPGVGTELTINGEVRGIIPGAEFASALFSIWIGEEPIDNNFRQQLMGLK
ncbi:MAG: chalcone isomerase family protein [Desulfobacterales bacterium]